MKVVINKQHGGFGLSPTAIKRLADLCGRPCYFFTYHAENGDLDLERHYLVDGVPDNDVFLRALDIPNPDELRPMKKNWRDGTPKEWREDNAFWEAHELDDWSKRRSDPLLVQVVEELGAKANGKCASLSVIDVPDGVEWEIEEYDGVEWIAEKHRTWHAE